MKRFLFLMLCLAFVGIASAQDIIVTTDAQKIEAKILEVSETEIRYKEKDNPNGPTFVISTEKISSIIYSNGKVSVFEQSPKPQNYPTQNSAQATQKMTPIATGSVITKIDDSYYQNGVRMSESEYLLYIQNNCVDAWQSYQKGKSLWNMGWAFFGAGMGSIVLGSSLIWADGSLIYSPILWGLGGGFAIGSIPCLIIGAKKKNNSHEVYNEVCASRNYSSTPLELNLQSSQNGIGLALKF